MLEHSQKRITTTGVVCDVCGHKLIDIQGDSENANLKAVRESGWFVVHVILVAKLEREQNRAD